MGRGLVGCVNENSYASSYECREPTHNVAPQMRSWSWRILRGVRSYVWRFGVYVWSEAKNSYIAREYPEISKSEEENCVIEIACRSRFQTVLCSCMSANIILNMDGKAESSSRQRTSNFTEEEVRCLPELVKERAEALFSKLNNSVTVKRKQTLWEDIVTRVNARGKTQRPTQKVKKKWSDLPYASEAG